MVPVFALAGLLFGILKERAARFVSGFSKMCIRDRGRPNQSSVIALCKLAPAQLCGGEVLFWISILFLLSLF